ncbi:hypothetical protein [Bdellovibrio bacteriovorus]|uniref:Outer membrane protein beta-barrel domain-containing protein n=1 Tax=Bdellovibrio bacteriovorus TaxID=959 RepID=A0A1Z3NC47_BDEBC|nr:hypothetical protein [Bdellovibrio bacteriovorus]ASD65042.1 hypothetical protein B9G79_16435 [Bdellovibrio bacteriovorus]
MKYFRLILCLLSLSISLLAAKSVQAYIPQRGNVVATLSPYFFQTNYDGHEQGQNKVDTGISLVANGDVDNKGSLEIAVIYMNKTYFREDGSRTVAEKTPLMHITMGYRRWWTELFSTSLALYTSYPMGLVDVLHNDFTPEEDMGTTARSTTETGLDLALQYELINRERFSIVAEGRYSYSLTKKSNEYADQYGASIGIRYFIQSKVASPKELRD